MHTEVYFGLECYFLEREFENSRRKQEISLRIVELGVCQMHFFSFLSASLYFSKRLKETLIEIGCVVTSLVVDRWLVVTRVHCGQTVHPRPIVTMEH